MLGVDRCLREVEAAEAAVAAAMSPKTFIATARSPAVLLRARVR